MNDSEKRQATREWNNRNKRTEICQRAQRIYRERKDAGVCTSCAGERHDARGLCAKCAERQRLYAAKRRASEETRPDAKKQQELYQWRKSEGICVKCRDLSRPGRVLCGECAKKSHKQWISWKRRNPNGNIEYLRKSYATNKALGVCVRCGHERARTKRFSCGTCAEKKRKR